MWKHASRESENIFILQEMLGSASVLVMLQDHLRFHCPSKDFCEEMPNFGVLGSKKTATERLKSFKWPRFLSFSLLPYSVFFLSVFLFLLAQGLHNLCKLSVSHYRNLFQMAYSMWLVELAKDFWWADLCVHVENGRESFALQSVQVGPSQTSDLHKKPSIKKIPDLLTANI